MEKILVSLRIPALSISSDVYIPDFLKIKEIIPLLVQAVEELSDQQYVSSRKEILCLQEKNISLQSEATLREYGVKNGDHLILM